MSMLVTTSEAFVNRVALERQMLELGVPLATTSVTSTYDLRVQGTQIAVGIVESMSGQAVDDALGKLLALFFGAAWKIVDSAVELALTADGVHSSKPWWPVEDKAERLNGGSGKISGVPDLVWRAISRSYIETIEIRHSLVHRTAKLRENGDLEGQSKKSGPNPLISRAQQIAFCQATQWLAKTIESGVLNERETRRFRGSLKKLIGLHGINDTLDAPEGEVVRAIAELPADLQLDVAELRRRLDKLSPGWIGADLELHTDYGILVGPLESAPNDVVLLDPLHPPPWLQDFGSHSEV
jgi:hypothetical protein